MNQNIENYINFVRESNLDSIYFSDIEKMLSKCNDSYIQMLLNISEKISDKKQLREIYNKTKSDNSLYDDECISYSFILNKQLPSDIIDELVDIVHTTDNHFYLDLLETQGDKVSPKTFSKIYSKCRDDILWSWSFSKISMQGTFNKEDIPFSEKIINMIALAVFEENAPVGKTHSGIENEYTVFKCITDKEYFDSIINKIRNLPDSKEEILTQMLNNPFISNEKKDKLFDEFGCNFRHIYPTPHMTDTIYRLATETLFYVSTDAETLTEEEYCAYEEAVDTLSALAQGGFLTSGMEYDLMQTMVNQKEITTNILAQSIINTTKDPRVLHVALQLKNSNDRYSVIQNPYLSKEDAVDLAKIFTKKINESLKARQSPLPGHIMRLKTLCKKATLPDDVYVALLSVGSSDLATQQTTRNTIVNSPYTPRSVLQRIINDLDKAVASTYRITKFNAKCMVSCIDHALSRSDVKMLFSVCAAQEDFITNVHGVIDEERKRNAENEVRRLLIEFKKNNNQNNIYAEILIENSSMLPNGLYKEAVLSVADLLKQPKLTLLQSKIDKNDTQNWTIWEMKDRLESLNKIAPQQVSERTKFYLDLEESAKEYAELMDRKIKEDKLQEELFTNFIER